MTHIFVTEIPEISNETFQRLLPKVSLERQSKIARIKQYTQKCESLMAEILCRVVLVQNFGMEEKDIIIKKTAQGKPFLSDSGLFISLSHTDGMVAVAVSDCEVGVDIERTKLVDLKIAKRFFTDSEQDYVFESDDATDRFFEIWTKKEAYIKKIGKGLSTDIGVCTIENAECFKTFKHGEYTVSVCTDPVLEVKGLIFCNLLESFEIV